VPARGRRDLGFHRGVRRRRSRLQSRQPDARPRFGRDRRPYRRQLREKSRGESGTRRALAAGARNQEAPMLRSLARVLPLVFLVPLVACRAGGALDPTGDGGSAVDPLQQLDEDTGVTWKVRYHSDVHIPAYLAGRTAPMAVTPADALRAGEAFLTHYHALFQISPDDALSSEGAETDDLGMTHARFSQKHDKVPVWGGDLMVHFDQDGALVQVNGRYLPVATPPLAPTLTADQARVAAALDARTLRPDVDSSLFVTRVPDLMIYPITPTEGRYAWRVETELEGASPPLDLETLVDAVDGSVLHHDDMIDTLEGSGVGVFGDTRKLTITQKKSSFYLEDASRGGQKTYSDSGRTRLPGSEVHSTDPDHWDEAGTAAGAAVDAHANIATTYDYYLKTHKRAGWDGKGTGIHAVVHYGQDYDNAFCDGSHLVFGDGDGATLLPTAAALDVVAHEYTHGITFNTAKLVYEGQSGALNEAISDLFGCFVSQASGRKGDWQMGETIYQGSNGKLQAMRDLADPHATDAPADMSEYSETTDDQGGVHFNSTIVSHAGYLMSEGGSFGRGLGAAMTARIWYRALTHYLTSRATFRDAADATLSAAHDLGADEDTVRAAWIAVGVLSK
jgi:Zn-dependent metalloprotease